MWSCLKEKESVLTGAANEESELSERSTLKRRHVKLSNKGLLVMQVLSVSTELHQRCPLLTLHQLHEDGDPGALLDSTVQGHHAGARHSRARRQLLGTEMFHLHLQKETERH